MYRQHVLHLSMHLHTLFTHAFISLHKHLAHSRIPAIVSHPGAAGYHREKVDEALSLKQTYGPLRPKEPFAMEALREADHGGRIW